MISFKKSLVRTYKYRKEMKLYTANIFASIAILYYSIASLLISNVFGQPIDGKSKGGAFYYLANYGYIQASKSENTAQLLSEEVLTKAIKDFQVRSIDWMYDFYPSAISN